MVNPKHTADIAGPSASPESNSTHNGTAANGDGNAIKNNVPTNDNNADNTTSAKPNNDTSNSSTTNIATDSTSTVAAPRAKINISLNKKKKTTNKSKSTPKQQQLINNSKSSLLADEYGTIAEEAEIISQRRKEEGNILVIPCKQQQGDDDDGAANGNGEEGEKRKQPLLAGRLALLRKDNNDGVEDLPGAPANDEVDKASSTKSGTSDNDAIEDEAVQQLIQSAEQKDANTTDIAGSTSHGRGLVISVGANKLTTTNNSNNNNNNNRHNDRVMNDEEVFQHELAHHAPDVDPTSNVYANVSIGDFGSALLRGMGWTGGSSAASNKGGGKTDSEEVVKQRPHRLGLGAKPLPLPTSSSSSSTKPGGIHRRARRPEDVKRDEERLRQQEEAERQLQEKKKLDVQYTLQKGSVVTVRDDSSNHADDKQERSINTKVQRRARVIQTAGVPGLNRILIQYEGEGKEVSITKSSVTLCSWDELDQYPFKQIPLVKKEQKMKNEMKQQQSPPRKMEQHENDGYDDSAEARRRKRDRSYSDSRDDERRRRRKDDRRRDHRPSHNNSDDGDSRDGDSYDDRRRSKKHKKRKKKDRRSRSRSDSKERDQRRNRRKDSSRRRDRSGSRSYSPEDSHRKKLSIHHHSSNHGSSSSHNNPHHEQHLHWLTPNIRVRLISNKIPKYYLQKGIVQDVMQPSSNSSSSGPKAVLLMDNGQVLDKVPERYLETALPKTGGHVIILESKDTSHHWKKGRLLERSSKDGYGIIQLEEDLEVIKVSLDGIAEWCGDMNG